MSFSDLFDLEYLATKLESGAALDEEELQIVVGVLRCAPIIRSKREQSRLRRSFITHCVAVDVGLGMSNKQAVGRAMDRFSASRSTVMECLSVEKDLYRKTCERMRSISDRTQSGDFVPTYVVQT